MPENVIESAIEMPTFSEIVKRRKGKNTRSKFGQKPNHQHAQLRETIGEHVADQKNRGKGTVSDLCDFCLKSIRVKRNFLGFRTRGWKFACFKCWNDKGFEFGKCKVFIETRTNKVNIFEV